MMALPFVVGDPNCSMTTQRSSVSVPLNMGTRLLESMVVPAVAAAGLIPASSRMVEKRSTQ